ncbi:MAG: PIG-L family deacetylase [Alphaproteobacteria bacterium]|nr:PIG-L family deacetylase [Alphaproteobacteria bacterium]
MDSSDEQARAHRRIARQAATSPLVELWNALLPLRSALSFMMTGAHPDDEASGLLARLAKKDGARTIYVCATRGQGGQNALGSESGDALAAIRTREMEEAARILDMEVHWLDRGFGDPISDFGFAKTAEATTAIWGEERLMERLVRVIRTARPDIICPTFLDVGGQHGHHRAMTRAALRAYDVAADPEAFPEHLAAGLAPWRIAKLYLPAFSGAGGSYDDAEPPPPATVEVDIGGYDRVLGATYAQIGEWSRACHRTQEMGLWRGERPAHVPLHRLQSRLSSGNAKTSLFDGLPQRLGDLAERFDAAQGDALRRIDAAIDLAFARFPDFDGVAAAIHSGLRAVDEAEARLDPPPDPHADDLSHRLAIKRHQLARTSRIALSLVARIELPDTIVAGKLAEARLSVFYGRPKVLASLAAVTGDGVTMEPDDHGVARMMLPQSRPFRSHFDPLSPAAPVVARLRYFVEGQEIEQTLAPDDAPMIVPPVALEPRSDRLVVRAGTPAFDLRIGVRNNTGDKIETTIAVAEARTPLTLAPGGSTDVDLRVAAPRPGRHRLAVAAAGVEHGRARSQAYPHVGRTSWIEPAEVELLVIDSAIPDHVRIGYVDAGTDRTAFWLGQLGLDVMPLDSEDFAAGDLARFDTIVVGVKAFSRPELARSRSRLHDFVRGGGHLVTQFHRSQDGWDGAAPERLEIGHPSIRWRVCDPAAPIIVLVPDHPLLTYPNRIGPEDWQGWKKERGLYFAASWHDAYQPLLALADPGEAPLKGGLLSARIGEGRHTHVSLTLSHQMDELVPGAFRLFANLVQAEKNA